MLERDKTKQCFPLSKILIDDEFNHRGRIKINEIANLMKDIKKKGGLIQPISIRPIKHDKFEWQVIDGHRRATAYRIMNVDQIPAVIENVDEFAAKTFSAVANLQKQDLNIMQEANAIKHLWEKSLSRSAIAKEVNMSPGWVQIRIMLLEMPKEVQDIASRGFLTQEDIKSINKVPLAEKVQYAFELHKQRQQGIKVRHKRKQKRTDKRARKPSEILQMMKYVRRILLEIPINADAEAQDLITIDGDNFATAFASWSAGYIDNYEFHKRLQKYCACFDYIYVIPIFD